MLVIIAKHCLVSSASEAIFGFPVNIPSLHNICTHSVVLHLSTRTPRVLHFSAFNIPEVGKLS